MHLGGAEEVSANRYAHIDAMRAFAVLLVVVAHAGLGWIVPGGSGVTMFFGISGFIITWLLLRERDRTGSFNARAFYFRRAAKIFPPLAALVIAPTAVWALSNELSWLGLASQLLFFYNWVKPEVAGGVLPGGEVVWSLSIEEQFYIAFALLWVALVRWHWWRLATVAVAVLVAATALSLRLIEAGKLGSEDRIYFGTDTRMDGIAIGVLAAVLLHAVLTERVGTRIARALGSDWTIAAAVVLYVVSLLIRDEWFRSTFRFTLQSVATALLILAPFMPGRGLLRSLFTTAARWRPVALIGLASYSIYLAHLTVMLAVAPLLEGRVPPLVATGALTLLGVASGIVAYRLLEVPALAWRKQVEGRAHARYVTAAHSP